MPLQMETLIGLKSFMVWVKCPPIGTLMGSPLGLDSPLVMVISVWSSLYWAPMDSIGFCRYLLWTTGSPQD